MARRTAKANVEILGRRRVLEGYIKIDEITYAFDPISRKGERITHTRRVMERGDSAAVLVYEKDSESFLLTEQIRVGSIGKGPAILCELVAGSIDEGESAADCIVRELREEVGYRVPRSALKKIGTFYLTPGGSSERIVLFYAEVTSRQREHGNASGLAEEGEDIKLVKLPHDAFVNALQSGRIADAKTAIAGYWMLSRND